MIDKLLNKARLLYKNSIFLYALVGVINTAVTWIIMVGLMLLGVIPEVANFIGWVAGFLNSYFLNKKFTFKSKNSHKKDALRFGIAMGVAYVANLLALIIAYRLFGINEYIAQIIAAVFYTITGYLISKFWAFKQDSRI